MACASEQGEEERHTHHRMAPKVAVGRFGRDVIAVAERERDETQQKTHRKSPIIIFYFKGPTRLSLIQEILVGSLK